MQIFHVEFSMNDEIAQVAPVYCSLDNSQNLATLKSFIRNDIFSGYEENHLADKHLETDPIYRLKHDEFLRFITECEDAIDANDNTLKDFYCFYYRSALCGIDNDVFSIRIYRHHLYGSDGLAEHSYAKDFTQPMVS